MDFTYNKKETYTQEELETLLKQHEGFVVKTIKAGTVSKEDHEKLIAELKPFKTKTRNENIAKLSEGIIDNSKINDAILLAGISDDDDDEAIKTKLNSVVETRNYLKPKSIKPPELNGNNNAKKVITNKKPEKTKLQKIIAKVA